MNEEETSRQQFSPKEAWLYAAQWGVAITGREFGACMYGFNEHCKVQSEDHRTNCLTWIDDCVHHVNAAPSNFDDDELKKLGWLKKYLEHAPLWETNGSAGLDEFTLAYVEAALFFTNDPDSVCGDGNLTGSGYTLEHLSPEAMTQITADCAAFQEKYAHLFTDENCNYKNCSPTAYAGHDFWLTRTNSGGGFWDGDWEEPAATILYEACKSKEFGDLDLYPGDDGRLLYF